MLKQSKFILYFSFILFVVFAITSLSQIVPSMAYAPIITPFTTKNINGNVFIPFISMASSQNPVPTPFPTQSPTIEPTPPPNVMVYYMSPNGNDYNSGTSEDEAWKTFTHAWQFLYPGDTLILLDGVYYQSLSPDVRNGEPGYPITIRAKNDGKVIIDGEHDRITVQLGAWPNPSVGYYFNIEGIIARNSSGTVYEVWGSYNALRRVSGYNANPDTNDHVFTIAEGEYNLIEDCVASGTGRKMAFSWGGGHNIIRRCFSNWVQHDMRDFCIQWPWGEDLELYNSSNNIIENSISYGSPPKTAVSIYGNIDSANGSNPYTDNNKILGVMSIRNGVFDDNTIWEWSTTRPQPTNCDELSRLHQWAGWRLGFGVIMWGEEALVSNTLFQDIFSWKNAGLGFSEFGNYNQKSVNSTINRATIIQNGLDAPPGDGGPGTNVIPDQISHYSISNSNIEDTPFNGEGARLQYRYVDGLLMDGSNGQPAQPLWPWPMQNRILTELGVDVTGELTNILKNSGVPTGAELPAPLISPVPHPGNIVVGKGVVSYISPVDVTISSSILGAEIRYTLDGTEPSSNSIIYSGTFQVSTPTIVRAKIFANDLESHSRSAYYHVEVNESNQPPEVEANVLPFVYSKAEIMLPENSIRLYGMAQDFTLPTSTAKLSTQWLLYSGPSAVIFGDSTKLRTTAQFSQPGTYVLRLIATDGDMSAHADATVTVLLNGGVPFTIPGKIEAENYRGGGEGVGYHDTSDGNYAQIYRYDDVDIDIAFNEFYGYSVVHLTPGEWLAYDVNISQSGVYSLTVRVAAALEGGKIHIELDGNDISGPITIPYTNDGMRIYTTISRQTPTINAGFHTIRIVADQAPTGETDLFAAINYIELNLD